MSSAILLPRIANGIYPERREKPQSNLDRVVEQLFSVFKRPQLRLNNFNRVYRLIEKYGKQYTASVSCRVGGYY